MKISTILFFCLLMTACMQTKSFHRTNGWYYVTSQTTDSLSQTPFLTVIIIYLIHRSSLLYTYLQVLLPGQLFL